MLSWHWWSWFWKLSQKYFSDFRSCSNFGVALLGMHNLSLRLILIVLFFKNTGFLRYGYAMTTLWFFQKGLEEYMREKNGITTQRREKSARSKNNSFPPWVQWYDNLKTTSEDWLAPDLIGLVICYFSINIRNKFYIFLSYRIYIIYKLSKVRHWFWN